MKTLSVKESDSKNSFPNFVYVIVSANLEYNDCTYDMFGEFLHKTKFFASEEEALESYVEILKNFYGDLRVYEICDLILYDESSVIETVLVGETGVSPSESELHLNVVIDTLNAATDKKFIYETFRSLLKIVKLEK